MLCNKCRQLEPHQNDTWCLSCTAWEQLGVELAAQWHNTSLRATAGDLVVGLTRNIRALRSYAGSLKSAGDRQAALSAPRASSAVPKRPPASVVRELPPPPPVPPKEEIEDPQESEEESEEEDEELCEGAVPKSSPASRPPEPAEPPRSSQKRSRERSGERKSRHHSSSHREHREKRDASHKHRKGDRGRRGGRKRQGLHRALTDPTVRVRQKPPAAFWDGPDRRDREPLARHRS